MTVGVVLLHGFGLRYTLPIPLALYLYAAAGVVVLSFVLVVLFLGTSTGPESVRYPRFSAPFLVPLARSSATRVVGGIIGVLALAGAIVAGFFGSPQPTENPSEYITWIFFWAGLVILAGLVGNLWAWLNPWTAIHDVIWRRPYPARLTLPDHLGIWPAVVVYFGFAGFELASGVANRPALVALFALLYTLATVAGMALFGRDVWLSRVEGFTILFDIVSRAGPMETERASDGKVAAVWLRPWGCGLLQPIAGGRDRIAFIILMLSTLAFDGIEATASWADFSTSMQADLSFFGAWAPVVVKTTGLLALTITFGLVFAAVMTVVVRMGGRDDADLRTSTAFALTLVPIALVYNAAHNYDYLVIQSQGIVPLLNDPLSRGWHLAPGLAHYTASWALAGAATVWYMQVILIVGGHVMAVWLAHLRAAEQFKGARQALLSQYPMLLLMVAYTMTSLSILAQQTTSG